MGFFLYPNYKPCAINDLMRFTRCWRVFCDLRHMSNCTHSWCLMSPGKLEKCHQ